MYNITRYMWNKKIKISNQRKLAEKVGMHEGHLSRIINRHQSCPTRTAIAITKAINMNSEVEDYFERV